MKKVIKKGGFLRDFFMGKTQEPQEKDSLEAILFFLALMLSLPIITLVLFVVIELV